MIKLIERKLKDFLFSFCNERTENYVVFCFKFISGNLTGK